MIRKTSVKLRPSRVHTVLLDGVTPTEPIVDRHYTLTHSDRTMDLFVTIGRTYHEPQISGKYTRFMRDEVLAKWQLGDPKQEVLPVSDVTEQRPSSDLTECLHVYVHVSGGRVYGRPTWRNQMLIRHLPLALRAIRYADAYLVKTHPELDDAPVYVHFQSHLEKFHRVEFWGQLREYEVPIGKSSLHRR